MIKTEHSFDIDIAQEYGIPAAILLKHIYYWVEKNRANDKHYINGNYWTYCSVKAFSELFPYMSAKVIRNGLAKLEEGELIQVDCFNAQAYDRTKWYTVTQNGRSLCRNGKRPLDKKENVFSQKGEPIPDIKPDTITDTFSKEKDNKILSETTEEGAYPEIIAAWNELSTLGISKARKIVPGSQRHKMLKARLKEYGEDSFSEIIDRVKESDWLQGKITGTRGKPFSLDFGWVIRPENYVKVLEGKYSNRDTNTDNTPRYEAPTGLEKPKKVWQ